MHTTQNILNAQCGWKWTFFLKLKSLIPTDLLVICHIKFTSKIPEHGPRPCREVVVSPCFRRAEHGGRHDRKPAWWQVVRVAGGGLGSVGGAVWRGEWPESWTINESLLVRLNPEWMNGMGYSPYFTCAKLIYRFDRASPGWSLVLSGPLWLFRCTYVWIRFYNSLCHFTKVDCAGPPAVRILGMRSCDFTGHINFPLSRCLARAKRIHRPKAPFNNKACYKGKAIVFEVEVAAIKHNKSSDPLNLVYNTCAMIWEKPTINYLN